MKKSINYNAMLYSKSNLPFFRFTITFKHELYEHVYKLGRRHICLDTEIRKHSFSKLLNLLFSTTFQPHLGVFNGSMLPTKVGSIYEMCSRQN